MPRGKHSPKKKKLKRIRRNVEVRYLARLAIQTARENQHKARATGGGDDGRQG